MPDYFRILDVPEDASTQEIRTRYKQLVRIFHPDRYGTDADKGFVQQKLQEINTAYRALMNPESREQVVREVRLLPQPVVFPDHLNFEHIARSTTEKKTFQVGNVGDAPKNFDIQYSEPDSWYRITAGRRVYPSKPFPMEFTIEVDTEGIRRGQEHTGYVNFIMDDVVAQAKVSMSVGVPWTFANVPIKMIAVMGTIVMILSIGIGIALSTVIVNNQAVSPAQAVVDQPAAPSETVVPEAVELAAPVVEEPPAVVEAQSVEPAPDTQLELPITVPDTAKVSVRSGTSIEADILGLLVEGSVVPAVGRTPDGSWLLIRLPDSRVAWVFADAVYIDRGQLSQLPVAQANN